MEQRRIAVFGNFYQDDSVEGIILLFGDMMAAGYEIAVERGFYDYLKRCNPVAERLCCSVDDYPQDSRALISLGGDGTFLRAAEWCRAEAEAIVGVNTGHLGYLAAFSLADSEEIVKALHGEGVRVARRRLLVLEGDSVSEKVWPFALNEVSILKAESSSMIAINARVNGIFLADYRCDGLIISSPTGSTGYNLSVGGPIMQPSLRALAISPIAPHSLTLRPLVVADNATIDLGVSARVDTFRVSLDGRSFTLPCDADLRVRASEKSVNIVMRSGDNFAQRLQTKLSWGRY